MRYGLMLLLAVGVAACDTDTNGTDGMDETDTTATTQPAAETTPPTAGTTGGAALQVDSLPDGGAYLTDAAGRALYVLEGEDEPTACVDACAEAWPPFTTEPGQMPMTRDAQTDLIDSVERPDGTLQVTYDGQPLYYYAQDTARGQTTGQDVHDEWGEWYLLDPSGEVQEGES